MLHEIKKDTLKFMFGGKSEFVIVTADGIKYTYKIKLSRNSKDNTQRYYFLSVAHNRVYEYIGYFVVTKERLQYKFAKNYVEDEYTNDALNALMSFIRHRTVEQAAHMYHVGRCAKCGRTLTDIDSIERGFGPECYKSII